jgi:hypothetical protein
LNHEDASAAALRRFDVIDVVQPRARLRIDDECSPAQNPPADRNGTSLGWPRGRDFEFLRTRRGT